MQTLPIVRIGRCMISVVERWLGPLVDLAARVYLADVFFQAGRTKLDNWEITVALFNDEYKVPLLPPELAAILGTAGELVFPVLLALGLGGRLGALGLSFVNIMAVVSYYHVLSQPTFAAALTQHLLWGIILALLVVHGPGTLSADALIKRHLSDNEADFH
ncbi:DoxX family protein [Chitinimonas lacunae]|uniref:DoxX family protein n=1 Tax=Chitinimonas lacunae TaxID=1963018 RepID=A0ABV8MUT6_9NEIS